MLSAWKGRHLEFEATKSGSIADAEQSLKFCLDVRGTTATQEVTPFYALPMTWATTHVISVGIAESGSLVSTVMHGVSRAKRMVFEATNCG
jgi:hypothetical protein